MSAPTHSAAPAKTLDLSKWSKVPNILMGAGGVLAVIGACTDLKQFSYSWLLAFMFFLSIGLGSLFLLLLHHLFDAMWTVPIRRFVEHLACLLFPWLLILFIPVLLLAKNIYPWMNIVPVESDHSLHAKHAYLNVPFWYIRVGIVFAVWGLLSHCFRRWSLEQDKTGAATWTHKSQKLATVGVILFALSLTAAAIDWVKSIEHQWFSTMYGVYYFAGSVWLALATVYTIMIALKLSGPLKDVVRPTTVYDCGKLFFAFTVFYAYIHFSQYFLIWNAALPEETFWYIQREQGSWKQVGLLILFGHFFIPFLALLRIDAKMNLAIMLPLTVWAWMMHFADMSFNIMPNIHPEGFVLHWIDLGCLAFMAGFLAKIFIKNFKAHPPYPQKDPRIAEAMGVYVAPASASAHAAK